MPPGTKTYFIDGFLIRWSGATLHWSIYLNRWLEFRKGSHYLKVHLLGCTNVISSFGKKAYSTQYLLFVLLSHHGVNWKLNWESRKQPTHSSTHKQKHRIFILVIYIWTTIENWVWMGNNSHKKWYKQHSVTFLSKSTCIYQKHSFKIDRLL